MSGQTLCVISPFYNEEHSVDAFYAELCAALGRIDGLSIRLLFVDDGSTDRTLEKLESLVSLDPRVEVLSLSRNFGHQAALSAGLDAASGDVVVMLDSDLQHPPSLIPAMVARWREGEEIVSAIRRSTDGAGLMKRASTHAFYWLINRLSDTKIVPGAADFVLLSRTAHRALVSMPERHRFLRGMVSWIGFRRGYVEYQASQRSAGDSKYTWTRMLGLALDAVFSFSVLPIRIASRLGALIAVAGVIYFSYVIWKYFATGDVVQGWASLISVLLIIGGTQLVFIGLIGEYLARTYEESKGRPLYVIRERRPAESPMVRG